MKTQLTDHNHLKFGYNGIPYTFRNSAADKWFVSFERCTRIIGPFRRECIWAAKDIHHSALACHRVSTVLLSGGVDSEVVAMSFLHAQINFRCASALLIHDDVCYNMHDVKYAIAWCERNSVDHRIYVIDPYDTRLENIAVAMQSTSPQFACHAMLLYKVVKDGGLPVIGYDSHVKNDEDGLALHELEKDACIMKYVQLHSYHAAPRFFQHTPELLLSYLTDPTFKRLVSDPAFKDSLDIKLQVYNEHWQLEPRPKFTGFEKLQDWDSENRNKLKKILGPQENCKIPYNELVSTLTCL